MSEWMEWFEFVGIYIVDVGDEFFENFVLGNVMFGVDLIMCSGELWF